jgi:hypothetical protein
LTDSFIFLIGIRAIISELLLITVTKATERKKKESTHSLAAAAELRTFYA